MRSIVVIGLAAAASAVGAIQFAPNLVSFGADDDAARLEARQAAGKVGARLMLATDPIHGFSMIVIGRHLGPGLIEFRAQAGRDRDLRPAYGRVRAICDEGVDQPACWRLDVLEIDGRSIALIDDDDVESSPPLEAVVVATRPSGEEFGDDDQTAQPLADETVSAPTVEPTPQRSETADLEATPLQEAPTPALARIETPATATQPDASLRRFQIAGDRVNARAGPGQTYDVLAVLDADTGLEIARGDRSIDGWTLYRVVNGDAAGAEVWIYDELVSEISR